MLGNFLDGILVCRRCLWSLRWLGEQRQLTRISDVAGITNITILMSAYPKRQIQAAVKTNPRANTAQRQIG